MPPRPRADAPRVDAPPRATTRPVTVVVTGDPATILADAYRVLQQIKADKQAQAAQQQAGAPHDGA